MKTVELPYNPENCLVAGRSPEEVSSTVASLLKVKELRPIFRALDELLRTVLWYRCNHGETIYSRKVEAVSCRTALWILNALPRQFLPMSIKRRDLIKWLDELQYDTSCNDEAKQCVHEALEKIRLRLKDEGDWESIYFKASSGKQPPTKAVTVAQAAPASSGAQAQATAKPKPKRRDKEKDALEAGVHFRRDPNLSDAAIARELGMHKSTLSRNEKWGPLKVKLTREHLGREPQGGRKSNKYDDREREKMLAKIRKGEDNEDQ